MPLCFAFLVQLIVAPLQPGQDPYAILGLERKATLAEIKSAFRAKTRKFHPDRYKGEDREKKWLKISDAYTLLSDPKQRERYDKYGLIDESMIEKTKSNRGDKIKEIIRSDANARSNIASGEFDSRAKKENIIELNDNNFHITTNDGRPWIIYVYENEHEFIHNKNVFDEFYQRTGFLFGMARLNAITSPQALKFLNIRTFPQTILYDRVSGNKTYHYTSELNLKRLCRFATQKFGADITYVENDHDIVVWRKSNLDKLHVILFSNLKEAPLSFELVAAFLKTNAVYSFATINKETVQNFPRAFGSLQLEELPTYTIYRMGEPKDDTFGGPVTPIFAPLDLDAGALSAIIRRFNYPVFPELSKQNFNRLCSSYCIMYVQGTPMADDIKVGVNDMNLPTVTINLSKETAIAQQYDLAPGDFFVLRQKNKDFVIWKEITTWREFRTKIELMNHGLGKFRKYSSLPEILNTGSTTISPQISKIRIFYDDLMMRMDSYWVLLFQFIRKLPPVVILIGLGLLMIGLMELIGIFFRTIFHTKQHCD